MVLVDELLDISTALTIEHSTNIPDFLNLLLNTLYFLFANICELVAIMYVIECIGVKKKAFKIFPTVFILLNATMLVINAFTGTLFSFVNHEYVRGPLFIANYLVPTLCILYFVALTLIFSKNLNRRQITANLLLAVVVITCTVIQMFFFPDILLIMFGFSIADLLLLFSLETPDYQELEYLRKNLENEVKRQTEVIYKKELEISKLSLEIVRALADAIDAKDEYTKGHSARVAQYSVKLAEKIGMSDDDISRLRYIAVLHDVGKIGIPDIVLNKPGRLTEEEFQIIKSHTTIGFDILKNITTLEEVDYIAQSHHERFDGSGYPLGLKGTDIPFMSRIISIADSYDAMSTNRVYRDSLSREVIREELIKGKGTQFDPALVDEFLELFDNMLLNDIDETISISLDKIQ
ncbi:MAG: HD-GYP domain-containing protein [Clostridia bacterium]|nr:HD-GYP domain-containing protein [Clostridia bacterium]